MEKEPQNWQPSPETQGAIGDLNKKEREIRVELHEQYGKIGADEFIDKVFELAEVMDKINALREKARKEIGE
jgi:DNA-binding response OmpR family regulator